MNSRLIEKDDVDFIMRLSNHKGAQMARAVLPFYLSLLEVQNSSRFKYQAGYLVNDVEEELLGASS